MPSPIAPDDEIAAPVEATPEPPAGPIAWPERSQSMQRGLLAESWTPHAEGGFAHSWFDESALRETFSMRRAGRRTWKGVSSTSGMEIDALLGDRTGSVEAYLYSIAGRPPNHGPNPFAEGAYEDTEAVLHLRHRGRVRAWWDGELVIDAGRSDTDEPRHSQARVLLTDAFDVLVIKLGRGPEYGPSANVDVRLSTRDGQPIAGQDFSPRRKNEYPRELD